MSLPVVPSGPLWADTGAGGLCGMRVGCGAAAVTLTREQKPRKGLRSAKAGPELDISALKRASQ